MIQEQVMQALRCFERDSIYGPALLALARERLTYGNFSVVSWSIELQGLAGPSAGLFFSDTPYYAERQQKSEAMDETDAFWHVACSHVPLYDRLKRLSVSWHDDVCLGAGALRAFFVWYLELMMRPLQIPFFLVEYVRRSLLKIDWHKIASNLLEVSRSACDNCHCTASAQETGIIVEYLGELFKVTADEIMPLGQRLSELERTQVLLSGDLCREATKAIRLFLREAGQR